MSVELARWFPARSAEAFLTRSTAALVSDVSTIGITHIRLLHNQLYIYKQFLHEGLDRVPDYCIVVYIVTIDVKQTAISDNLCMCTRLLLYCR